jgi:hypothetical protein
MSFVYTPSLISQGLTYEAYREKINDSLRIPPANEQEEKLRVYTEKNVSLMNGFDATYEVSTAFEDILKQAPEMHWLVLTEGWCGDAAFSVPLLAKIAQQYSEKIKLYLYFRDTHLDLMDAHLTNGGRSIPKLVILDSQLLLRTSWGPRPEALSEKMLEWKQAELPFKELVTKVHQWYHQDDTQSVQQELQLLLKGL